MTKKERLSSINYHYKSWKEELQGTYDYIMQNDVSTANALAMLEGERSNTFARLRTLHYVTEDLNDDDYELKMDEIQDLYDSLLNNVYKLKLGIDFLNLGGK